MKKTRKPYSWIQSITLILVLFVHTHAEKQKRQIFREQVLPALGGKIPEEAFKTDRLALNRLNKEGISVPDGIILDARQVQKHSHHEQPIADVIKVYLTPDGRYVTPEGKIHYEHPKSVDTTYVIRMPYLNEVTHSNLANQLRFYKQKQQERQSKSQSYSSYRQLLPLIPTKPGIYQPIVTSLVVPHNGYPEHAYSSGWNLIHQWEPIYEPDEYFIHDISLINSHKIINDYPGFLNDVHRRNSEKHYEPQHNFPDDGDKQLSPRHRIKNSPPRYPNLTKLPKTNFTCEGRKGTFADIGTKCQVFHECSGWSLTSSLCPIGTAYSEDKKRCEWWNTVQCNY